MPEMVLKQWKYKNGFFLGILDRLSNFPTPRSSESIESPWYNYFTNLRREMHLIRGNAFDDSVYKKYLTICRKNKENDDAVWLLPAFLDKMTKENKVFCDKISQLQASQNTAKHNNKFSDKTDMLRTHINSLKFSMCDMEGSLLSHSHRAQVVEIKPKPSL